MFERFLKRMRVVEKFSFKVNRRIFLAGFGQVQAFMAGPAKPINVKTVGFSVNSPGTEKNI